MGADHLDAGKTEVDYAADIADVFIFPSPEVGGRMVGAITFGGGASSDRVDSGFNCDPNVLYVFNIARDQGGDTFKYDSPDLRVFIRFGTNAAKTECGVQFDNVPGAGSNLSGAKVLGAENSISGPIEQVIVSPTGLRAFAGYRNDPFFFDLQAFSKMITRFRNSDGADGGLIDEFRLSDLLNRRDSFAGRNVSAVVFEMDTNLLARLNGGVRPKIRVWATTGRKPIG